MSGEDERKRGLERPAAVPEGFGRQDPAGQPWIVGLRIDTSPPHYRDGTWGPTAAREIADELRRQLGIPEKGPLMPATQLTDIRVHLTDGEGRPVVITGRDAAGEWRYVILGGNAEPMTTSEGYAGGRDNALRGYADLVNRVTSVDPAELT